MTALIKGWTMLVLPRDLWRNYRGLSKLSSINNKQAKADNMEKSVHATELAAANLRTAAGGYTDSRGEWRPPNPVSYAPIFVWPPKVKQFVVWLFYYLFTWNLIYLGIVIVSYYFLQPPLEAMKTITISWVSVIFLRNMALVWIIYGGWHLYLYIFKSRGSAGKYSPRWQSTSGTTFLWKDQVLDNMFWTCLSGVPVWTAYEVLTFWLYANGRLPYVDFNSKPVYFIVLFLLIPFWREFHFYLIHKLIHWKPLYKRVHYLHHYNINPGPWSGMAMHPVEHLLYFSVVLIHFVVPSHPLHFLFNSQHTALTPAAGHSGFEGRIFKFLPFGSYFHYLHHRLFDCNYGESTIPMDRWFGVFEDGSQTQTEKQEAASAYTKLVVTEVVDESAEVKSFYLSSTDGSPLKESLPGQNLTFKIPLRDNRLCLDPGKASDEPVKYALRSYTISGIKEHNKYRISVRNEPDGLVSKALHQSLQPGDILEAKGPKGSFVYRQEKGKTAVFIAAGIGITPFIPMLKSLPATKEEIFLILAAKENNLLCFKEEIRQVCDRNPNIQVHVFFSRQKEINSDHTYINWHYHTGRAGIESLQSILPTNRHFNFYICGPEAMTVSLTDAIKHWKGSKSKVYTETFLSGRAGGNIHRGTQRPVMVHFAKSGRSIEWDYDYRNILEFAESNGIRLEAGCMFGECGACSTKVIAGEFQYNYVTATRAVKGNCLPCSCHPSSDLSLDA
jgi:ferredoxin-NADP reductase/sterol desaturase/sphingolipid hydroxylase (fatty acid hydroxylase superfamily)